jgi:hypothetical protein
LAQNVLSDLADRRSGQLGDELDDVGRLAPGQIGRAKRDEVAV